MDVQIPTCFDFYNKMHMFENIEEAKYLYAVFASGMASNNIPGFASQCVACGSCLEKCPQHIAIPDFLEKVSTDMEGQDFQEYMDDIRQRFNSGLA